jgi:putative hemin transport protein
MALTRNDHAVHERKGHYRNVSARGQMGLVLDEELDLRIFLGHWHIGFAVEEETRDGIRRSLQIFDCDGTAVHKIYMQEDGDLDAYNSIVERFRAADQSSAVTVQPLPAEEPEVPDTDIDYAGFYNDWRSLQDTHDFFGLLKKFNVSRMQALRNAERDLAVQVPASSLRNVLEQASASQTPIMIFVGSPGVIQIHGGAVERIVITGPWVNVLDPRFNLHLREDAIASAWIVRKPTSDGTVTSLELFDAQNRMIAQLFGKRKPGMTELEEWRQIINSIEHADGVSEDNSDHNATSI